MLRQPNYLKFVKKQNKFLQQSYYPFATFITNNQFKERVTNDFTHYFQSQTKPFRSFRMLLNRDWEEGGEYYYHPLGRLDRNLTSKIEVESGNLNFLSSCAQKIAVGVSGGSDSICLIYLLNNLISEMNENSQKPIQLIAIHVDHKVRLESTADASIVESIMQKKGIKFVRLTIDWDKLCGVKKNQETFRNEVCWFLIYHFILGILTDEPQRYKLMSEYCRKNSIHFLFTGHNKNDQVETFLFRQMRSSTMDGLRGMRSGVHITPDLIVFRPLLHFTKEEIENTCTLHNWPWIEDPSNQKTHYTRNLIRQRMNQLQCFDDFNLLYSITSSINEERDTLLDSLISKCVTFSYRFGIIRLSLANALKNEIILFYLLKYLISFLTRNQTISSDRLNKFVLSLQQPQKLDNFAGCIFKLHRGNLFITADRGTYLYKNEVVPINQEIFFDDRWRILIKQRTPDPTKYYVRYYESLGILGSKFRVNKLVFASLSVIFPKDILCHSIFVIQDENEELVAIPQVNLLEPKYQNILEIEYQFVGSQIK